MNDPHPSGTPIPTDTASDFSYAAYDASYDQSGYDAYGQQGARYGHAATYDSYSTGAFDTFDPSYGGGDPLYGALPGTGSDGGVDAYDTGAYNTGYGTGQFDTTGWADTGSYQTTGGIPAQPGPEQADYGYPAGPAPVPQWGESWDPSAFGAGGYDTGQYEGQYDAGQWDTGPTETAHGTYDAFETYEQGGTGFEQYRQHDQFEQHDQQFEHGVYGHGAAHDVTADQTAQWTFPAEDGGGTAADPFADPYATAVFEPVVGQDNGHDASYPDASYPFEGHPGQHFPEPDVPEGLSAVPTRGAGPMPGAMPEADATAAMPMVDLSEDYAEDGEAEAEEAGESGEAGEAVPAAAGFGEYAPPPRDTSYSPYLRNRRRAPRRSALLTIAVPSVAVMGVAGVAAATVMDTGSQSSEDTSTQASDPSSVHPSAANDKLDSQLARVSAADDFADRANRTQERLDLKKRQEVERKRKAVAAAHKEAMRPKFALPVKQHGLSATFGQAGVNWLSVHTGIDFPVSYGTPVMAANDGTVTTLVDPSFGNVAKVKASDGTETWYCHLSSIKIRSGEVKAGETIAYSGNSGNSTGPHLHFEVHPGGGDAIDPLPWLQSKGLNPN